jgi:hypothetical protein
MINGTAADKIIALLVRGEVDEAEAYLKFFSRDDRRGPNVRAAVAARARPEFMPLLDSIAPWLVNGFAEADPVERVRSMLAGAGAPGAAGSAIRRAIPGADSALAEMVETGEVVARQEKTGGRPVENYRLAQFDVMRNPFAS